MRRRARWALRRPRGKWCWAMGRTGSRVKPRCASPKPSPFWTGRICGGWCRRRCGPRGPRPRWRAVRRACYQALKEALWHGQVDVARGQLEALRPGPLEAAVEALEAALTYLEHQRAWIGDYQHWRDLGYPVGSGLVERAVALIINRRLKRQGMRWR